ncbi:DCTN6 family protein [Megaselia abdita]
MITIFLFSLKIYPKALVCEESNIKGDVIVSAGCVIHPHCNINAENGSIIFGENCIVEEYATISNKNKSPGNYEILYIGCNNVFEVGCTVEALKIGDKNVFEAKSIVSNEVEISNGCIIGAGCRLEGKQTLLENTVIYGNDCLQREALEKQGVSLITSTKHNGSLKILLQQRSFA